MLDIQEVTDVATTTNTSIDEDDERWLSIRIGRLEFLGVTQAAKDGFYAGRKHSREHDRMDFNEFDCLYWQGKLLETHPTPAEFGRYIRRVRPKNYTGEDAEQWTRYFIAGWYSRVFQIDTCNHARSK